MTPIFDPSAVVLREVRDPDLDAFFAHQNDPVAIHMAGFTAPDRADRAAFDAHWRRLRADPSLVNRTVVVEGQVAGHVARFLREGTPEVTYWIAREHWGRGVATRALAAFVAEHPERPLHARVAKDNVASRRVLEKCGFVVTGEDRGWAEGRGAEVEELLLTLG